MKKRNLTKMLAVMAAATMAMTALAGCGGSSKEETTAAAAETTAAAAEETTAAAAAEETTAAAAVADTDWEGAATAAGLSGKVTYMHFGDDYEREMYANVFSAPTRSMLPM